MRPAFLLLLAACLAGTSAGAEDFLPISVWYGGGKVRAPMLVREPAREREEWRQDLQKIKALGFNTVRMWADWASTEPERGRYRLEYVDQMMDLAEEAGLRVIIQIYTDSAPEWLGARFLPGFAEQAGVKPPVELAGAGPLLKARLLQGPRYRLLFLLNHSPKRESGRVALAGAAKGREIFTGATHSFPLEFDLEPSGTMVLEVG